MAGEDQGGMLDQGMQKGKEVIDFLGMTAQGMYYDRQVQQLGLNPNDPNIVAELEKQLKELNSMQLEEYVMQAPQNSTLGAATQKASKEQALQSAFQYYSKKYPNGASGGNAAPPGFDFFRR